MLPRFQQALDPLEDWAHRGVSPQPSRGPSPFTEPAFTSSGTAPGAREIGLIEHALAAEGITYLAGGLLFGIALFRARILTRWGSALLSAGAVFTVSLSVLPESFYRLLAYPNAIALIALGYSLWRAREHSGSTAAPDRGGALRSRAVPSIGA